MHKAELDIIFLAYMFVNIWMAYPNLEIYEDDERNLLVEGFATLAKNYHNLL